MLGLDLGFPKVGRILFSIFEWPVGTEDLGS